MPQRRNENTAVRTKRFEGIDSIDPVLWDRITTGHPFAGRHWCRYAETYQRKPSQYVIVYDGAEPVGGAIFMVMPDEDAPTTNRLIGWFLTHYLRWRPLVVCRTAPTTAHKALFLPDDAVVRARTLTELRRAALDIMDECGGSFLLIDYLYEHEVDFDWGDFFPLKDFTNVGNRMDLTWDSWDAFMVNLRQRSKKQHKNVRNNTRYAQQRGVTIHFSDDAPPQADVLRLVRNKMRHYGHQFNKRDVIRVMDALTVLPAQNVIWVTACCEGRIVACEVLLYDDATGVCLPQLYGRDYDVKYVYFYMAYRDIQYMIEELNAKTVIYDTEAYEFKQRIGFEEDSRNHLVFYPGSALERGLTRVLMRFMND